MMHKINVVLASIFTAVVMAVFPPVNCFLYRHLYLILPVMAGLWLLAYLVLFLLFWIFSAFVSLTINTKKTYEKQSRFYCKLFALIMEYGAMVATANITVTGMEKLPKPSEGRFLFVSNHKSVFDTFIQVGAFRKYPFAFISKPENFKITMGHRYMTRCRYMAIDREDVRSGAKITRLASQMISSGDSCVGVYPEGTRNKTDETLIEFKHGCFKSAVWAKSPIVIGVLHNTVEKRDKTGGGLQQIPKRYGKIGAVVFPAGGVLRRFGCAGKCARQAGPANRARHFASGRRSQRKRVVCGG